jgi:hypothetical protein
MTTWGEDLNQRASKLKDCPIGGGPEAIQTLLESVKGLLRELDGWLKGFDVSPAQPASARSTMRK